MKSKVIYMTLILVALWYAILYNTYSSALTLIGVLLLPIALFIILIIIYKNTLVTLSISSEEKDYVRNEITISKNETLSVYIIVKNKSFFPITNLNIVLRCHNSITGTNVDLKRTLYIDSKKVQAYEVTIDAKCCGNLEVKLIKYKIHDYLGLFSIKKSCTDILKIRVLPELYEIEVSQSLYSDVSGSLSDNYSTLRSGDDPSEIFGLREYQEGDKIQKIHWKLSMKNEDNLVVKEYSEPIQITQFILIEFHNNVIDKEGRYNLLSSLIETALSVSYSLLLNGIDHYIIWFDSKSGLFEKRKVSMEEELLVLMELLLDVRVYEEKGKALDFQHIMDVGEEYSQMYYVTDNFDDEIRIKLSEIESAERKKILEIVVIEEVNKRKRRVNIKNRIDKENNVDLQQTFEQNIENHVEIEHHRRAELMNGDQIECFKIKSLCVEESLKNIIL